MRVVRSTGGGIPRGYPNHFVNFCEVNDRNDKEMIEKIVTVRPQSTPMALDPLNRQSIGHFLNLTCDIELIDMRQGFRNYSDMRHGHFLNSTCDIGINN